MWQFKRPGGKSVRDHVTLGQLRITKYKGRRTGAACHLPPATCRLSSSRLDPAVQQLYDAIPIGGIGLRMGYLDDGGSLFVEPLE